jgi:hypothetical protein
MTPAALNAGDRIFLCWIETTRRLRDPKPSPANLPHLSRRGPTSFECLPLEEFEESLIFLVKTAF